VEYSVGNSCQASTLDSERGFGETWSERVQERDRRAPIVSRSPSISHVPVRDVRELFRERGSDEGIVGDEETVSLGFSDDMVEDGLEARERREKVSRVERIQFEESSSPQR